ncbi:MAG: TraR/DksA C4-type zinc finger protein [Candidatus Yonathbacteria bacterium]|nr:TraR/DksA C4-type zinc finger protein [Candidatus Yonathbacteria bacterium]
MSDQKLTVAELKQIEIDLTKERERLEHDLLEFADPSKANRDDYQTRFPQFGNKDDENAAEVANFSDQLSLEQTLESQLADVRSALGRLAKGTYGACRYCGNPIDKRRLLARPTSGSCVECKKKMQDQGSV